ncbi:MAG: imelysin family protein, partial [Flavobacteriales bacterium]|nr:imelysin family protein [Flavobacteriales bacterium]
MRKIILLCLGLLSGITACDTPDNLVNCDFDQEALLINYADEIIIPRFDQLQLALLFLEASVQAFYANPTPGLLVEIQISLGGAYLAYEECGSFAFGPGLISGIPFRERFNTFPTNTTEINQRIQNGDQVSSSPKSVVGFPAVEYLLFGELGSTTSDIVELFTTDPNAANRRDYLEQLVTELKTTSAQIKQRWSASGDNYRQDFIANTGTANGTSISLLINEMSFDFETLKNFKFKVPLGKLNGGVVIPESVEAYYSGGSMELTEKQVEAFRELYLGIGSNGSDGPGLYEFLVCLETESSGALLAD